jgi:excisionase family DNA binding protein
LIIKLPEKSVFRVDEVAKILDVSISTVYYMIRFGSLKAINPTGKKSIRITRQSLQNLIQKKHVI